MAHSLFTMKRDLETLKRRAEENLGDEPCISASTTKRPTRQSSCSRVYDPICIFCQKAKYLKRTSSREKLIKVTQLRVDQRPKECAAKKGDDKILPETFRDIIAAEAHYHASCYRNYTRVKGQDQEDLDSRMCMRIAQMVMNCTTTQFRIA